MASRRMSKRSLYILQEIRKNTTSLGLCSEELDLPYFCAVEFPLTKDLAKEHKDKDAAFDDVRRFKLINIHVHVTQGPYAGGVFVLEVDLRETPDYPNVPPKCRYLTKVWHPNVNEKTGRICHSHLRSAFDITPGTWNPMLRLQPLIMGIISHFNIEDSAFAPMDPLNPEAASQYLNDNEGFLKKVKEWTVKFAQPQDIDPINAK